MQHSSDLSSELPKANCPTNPANSWRNTNNFQDIPLSYMQGSAFGKDIQN